MRKQYDCIDKSKGRSSSNTWTLNMVSKQTLNLDNYSISKPIESVTSQARENMQYNGYNDDML